MDFQQLLEMLRGDQLLSISRNDEFTKLTLEFHSFEGRVELADLGQQCCEERYFNTDDLPRENVYWPIGEIFRDIEVRNEDQDMQVILISTDKRVITIVAYNEHNGYYAGINLSFYVISYWKSVKG